MSSGGSRCRSEGGGVSCAAVGSSSGSAGRNIGCNFGRRCGALYVVGTGDFGQLGLGDMGDNAERTRPVPLDAFGGRLVTLIACGGMHSLAVTEDGELWSWGVNDEGSLGRVVRRRRGATRKPLDACAASLR